MESYIYTNVHYYYLIHSPPLLSPVAPILGLVENQVTNDEFHTVYFLEKGE